jgi:hypothetical protein
MYRYIADDGSEVRLQNFDELVDAVGADLIHADTLIFENESQKWSRAGGSPFFEAVVRLADGVNLPVRPPASWTLRRAVEPGRPVSSRASILQLLARDLGAGGSVGGYGDSYV